ncbi:glucosamine-6-phosphate isomerase [Mammaliicoccus stepanovicii]|uniref:Glucosamine-6-phosphate isomerase n=1 Tax=Mammaliicoccus stepanovicii TaxID=643214 RepID=A0A239YV80_9STAP|nr:glucosamine-6-phosphate isomerase [Mammaliicoccus stepanovicii]PNZ75591.1 glucosamine-6-phosphate isomerase [Mammaliicoccus stepanovicii]GGI40643.1 glucosamine-6-phosphate isomerase [Mammaliicoccus stepanovicii]SNV62845.1 glucosamine-6-phosphate isomerase [Mammaliicoccus stepanovicii]
MALNFKVFETKGIATRYVADLVRKQFNGDSTSVVGINLDSENTSFFDELLDDVKKNPVDFSQIHILDYDGKADYYTELGVPTKQVVKAEAKNDVESLIKDKVNTDKKKNKLMLDVITLTEDSDTGLDYDSEIHPAREVIVLVTGKEKAQAIKKLYEEPVSSSVASAKLKQHRMVTVVLDNEAAQGLPEDVRSYFTIQFS